MLKFCNKCNIEKDINLFGRRKISKDGYENNCKECVAVYKNKWNKDHYVENKEILFKRSREWAKNNPDKIKERNKKSREKMNKDERKKTMREYRQDNKEKILIQRKEYLKNNPEMRKKFNQNRTKNMSNLQRIKLCMRNILNKSLKNNGYSKKSKTESILGCSFNDLVLHLESKFEPWMSWENHGKFNGEYNYGWDIDHIYPLDLGKNEEEILKLNHYTNLQPLCGKINRHEKRNYLLENTK